LEAWERLIHSANTRNILTSDAILDKNITLELNKSIKHKDIDMASNTTQTRTIRKKKLKKSGSKRKHANENKGSTPKFAIHPDKA
jgi:hypothetical protein